jgi:MinD-like ATPase involved in chromosome partitioning or flagellar assembly/Tfp pilus assembly protein PilF
MTVETLKASFITFYSFKGGVGRSMALINTAAIMAERGFRVLVVDMDLEAPGLSFLMRDAGVKEPLQPGLIDLLADAKERGEEADLFALPVEQMLNGYTCPYPMPRPKNSPAPGVLNIMPAGKLDGDYTKRFDGLNLRGLYEEGLGEPLMRAFKKKIAESGLYDFVLIDSRTGFSDEAGVCTRDLADYLVVLSGLNKQNVEGTSNFLRVLRGATGGKANFMVILSPVPNGEDELTGKRKKAAQAAFNLAWGKTVELDLEIPYHPRLALTEEPHIFRQKSGFLTAAYRKIEKNVLKGVGLDAEHLLPELLDAIQREDYLPALQKLEAFSRLDDAKAALTNLVMNVLWRPELKAPIGANNAMPPLEQIVANPVGRKLIAFFVEHVSYEDGAMGSQLLLDGLLTSLVDLDLAEAALQRFIAVNPKHAVGLGNYAVLLAEKHSDFERAQAFYLRAIEAGPKYATHLGNYAAFLVNQRGDFDQAQAFYLRAIEADPKHAASLGSYAAFLSHQRGDFDQAQVFYLRAIDADPKHANSRCNYGQFLLGNGQFSQGEQQLLAGVTHIAATETLVLAELCLALWFAARLQNQDPAQWLQGYKFYLQQGFKRTPWNFTRILAQAEKLLPPEEFTYAQALAAAFLDADKVAQLDQFETWRALPSKPVK